MRYSRKRKVTKKPTGGKRSLVGVGDRTYRSNTERRLGDCLQQLHKTVQYEPKKFELMIPRRYIPDFYLEEFDLWVECKGTFEQDSREKCLAFHDDGYNLVVVIEKINNRMFDRMKTNEMWLEAFDIPYLQLYANRDRKLTKQLDNLYSRLTMAKVRRQVINQQWLLDNTKEVRDEYQASLSNTDNS
jgi:hypothetical protein